MFLDQALLNSLLLYNVFSGYLTEIQIFFLLLSLLLSRNLWACKGFSDPCQNDGQRGLGHSKQRKWTLAQWLVVTLFIIHRKLPVMEFTTTAFHCLHSPSGLFPPLPLCSQKMTSPPTSLGKLRTSDENSHKFPSNSLSFLWIITQTFFLPAHLGRNFSCHMDRLTP